MAFECELNIVHRVFSTPVRYRAVNSSIVDEDLAVWMRTAAMPTFKKLHRIIKTDLNAGDRISFTISSRMCDQFRIAGCRLQSSSRTRNH